MFWRNKRFFKRQHFVAISLFADIDRYKIAKIDYRDPNFYGLYAIKCGADGGHTTLGWAYVTEHASGAVAWNEDMRNKRLAYAIWQDGMMYERWEGRPPPDPKLNEDVQLCVVYEVNTKYQREAANEAWHKLTTGWAGHVEWYDASPDRKWTKLFRPNWKPQSVYGEA
jgi:hypothetical protein